MQIEIVQKQLEKLLTTAYKAISNRPVQPILSCFLIQADVKEQEITVTSYDGKLGITARSKCKVRSSGTVALSARLFADIVSSTTGTLLLEIAEKQAVITHSTGKCRLATMDEREFPELVQVEGESVLLPMQTLKEAFSSTLFAAAKDEIKQILAGIHLQLSANSWECAATDGHRLGVISSNDIKAFDRAVTIPQATISCLKELLNGTSENCQIAISNNAISFNLQDICLTSSLLEGTYPNYKSLIPKQFDYHFTTSKNSLKAALERVTIVTCGKEKIVQVTFTSEQATLYAESADVGGAIETVPFTGGDASTNITFGFNAKYLLEALRAIATSEVTIKASAPTYPVVLSPSGNSNQIALVMPVQLKEVREFASELVVAKEVLV